LNMCLEHFHVPVRVEACKACEKLPELNDTLISTLIKRCLDADADVRLHAVIGIVIVSLSCSHQESQICECEIEGIVLLYYALRDK
jgi:hypothetical protein